MVDVPEDKSEVRPHPPSDVYVPVEYTSMGLHVFCSFWIVNHHQEKPIWMKLKQKGFHGLLHKEIISRKVIFSPGETCWAGPQLCT